MSELSEVERFIADLNSAWQEDRYDDLREFYHPQVVMVHPSDGNTMIGVDEMVDSYRTFRESATLHSVEFTELQTHAFDAAVVCHLRFAIDYELSGNRFQDEGTEIYTLQRQGDRFVVISRTQIPG